MTRDSRKEARIRILKGIIKYINTGPLEEIEQKHWQWLYVQITFFVVLVSSLLYGLLAKIGSFVFDPVVLLSPNFVWITSLVLLLVGFGLYLLREKNRFFYGLIETGFAIAVVIHSARMLPNQGVVAWATAAGSVYLLIRGLDNLVTGYKAPPKK